MERTIEFPELGISVRARDGDSLLDVIRASGIGISADCGGLGRCGKCAVNADGERRLACRTFVDADMSVSIPSAGARYDILTGTDARGARDAAAAGEPPSGTALAIDIGTTTVALQLIDSASGRKLGAGAALNAQRAYGADVISRIGAAMDDASDLSGVITGQIDGMVAATLKESGVDAGSVRRVAIAGNTAMSYLLLGLPCRSLGLAPFKPEFTFKDGYTYREVFHAGTLDAPVLVMPFISAYVGGDITAGLLTREALPEGRCADGAKGSYMLVDMGTNGEIAYRSEERLLCTATAAGPAFEGGSISCGSGSVEGAVSKVGVRNGEIEYGTIGDAPARSICGSGLLDAMACLVREGIIDRTGAMNENSIYVKDKNVVIAAEGDVTLSQRDVREFQLAKSAVRAGIETLIEEMGGRIPDRFYLAGGLGQHLDANSAFITGLLPETARGRVTPIGNSSLAGASLAAADERLMADASRIADMGGEINLASHHRFNELFMEYMIF
ncbi:MAG: ASKHA domain-containing protein [Clostridiales Family XIII bacterium]|jgi:uncharacterized 2Fe-2S/4Fe-4S cluster protein (DUF4445 family)|nr:ASKHA domain-containing protein [Clostridiales Family XIII bacterium]